MVGTFEGSKSLFLNSKSKVSAHYLISQKGEVLQMVKDEDTAWHCYGFNSSSIGIEFEDKGQAAKDSKWITKPMWDKGVELAAMLCSKHSILVNNILPHSEPFIQKLGEAKGFKHFDPQNFPIDKFRKEVQIRIDEKK